MLSSQLNFPEITKITRFLIHNSQLNCFLYPYIVLFVHFTCILTENTKIYEEKFVGLKKKQIWYPAYSIFEVSKLGHNEIVKIGNKNHIFDIIYAFLLQKHIK